MTMNESATPVPQQALVDGLEPKKKKKKKKKGKKKYSRGLKFGQKGETSVSKGGHRLARAIEEGLSNWRRNRNKSSRKKRDGAVRDAMKNSGKSLSKFTKVASKVPRDVTDSLPKIRRMFR